MKIVQTKLPFFFIGVFVLSFLFFFIYKYHQNQKTSNIIEKILLKNYDHLIKQKQNFDILLDSIVNINQDLFLVEIKDADSNSIYKFENTTLESYYFILKWGKKTNINQYNFIIKIYYKFYLKDLLFLIFINFLINAFIYIFLKKQILKIISQRKADLYLIHQLFEPFQKFQFYFTNFKIHYIVKQLNTFEFNKNLFQIGGDYIYLKNITLRNRKYLFFINADAMGKSLQGLGGTIVLSSVLSAILKRTEKMKTELNKYPDTWLKYTSLEIQEVLETFEGFMMISAVMGLIDEENGFLYLLNFDHPKPIILNQNNELIFIESKIHKKLGFPKENHFLQVHRSFLEQNDSILAYSDGCIELEINKKINENETIIKEILLETLENISNLLTIIQKKGQIKDDISLIKIQYLNKIPQKKLFPYEQIPYIQNINDTILEIKKFIYDLVKQRKYTQIINQFQDFINSFPIDDELLYILSYSYRKIKKWELSIEIGERLLNFNSNYKKNYYNLIYCYARIANFNRMETLILEFQKHFPEETNTFQSKIKKFLKNS